MNLGRWVLLDFGGEVYRYLMMFAKALSSVDATSGIKARKALEAG